MDNMSDLINANHHNTNVNCAHQNITQNHFTNDTIDSNKHQTGKVITKLVKMRKKLGKPKAILQDFEPEASTEFKYRSSYTENHRKPIYGIKFANVLSAVNLPIFATVGANRISIYKCLEDGSIKFLLCYQDPDRDEQFYTCAWSIDMASQNILIAAAGVRGIIRILSPNNRKYHKYFIGHGQAINELKFHPKNLHVLLSASKDHSLRLWNIHTEVCIAVFGGVDGHRAEVLSADFDILGKRIVSSSMDHSVKVWRLDTPEMQQAIENSAKYNLTDSDRQFSTLLVSVSDFSTREVHCNYVDSVLWMGDFILSKQSCENAIVCWTSTKLDVSMPGRNQPVSFIYRFEYEECDLWYIRFALDHDCKYLAVGHDNGKIFMWNLDEPDMLIKRSVLGRKNCNSTVRQLSFSRDGKILIAVCDNGTIWRWDHMDLCETTS